jgi:hypothetical protein
MERLIRILACATLFGCSDEKVGTDGGSDADTIADSGGMDGSKLDAGTQDTGLQDTGSMFEGGMPEGGYQLTCQSYCAGMASICTGSMDGQYLDTATCLAMCANFTVGDAGAQMGNTLACRIYHLTVASVSQASADSHCPHAGPYGFGQCGDECEGFCLLYNAQCGANTFGGGGCAQGCPGINNPQNLSMSFLFAMGNTVDCREYHLENAYKFGDMNGTGHCAHASQDGGNVCK